MALRNFRDLVVWQRAMQLVVDVYEVTRTFPSNELYGLTSQLRRAAVSIPSNIAEGWHRGGRDFVRFVGMAQGSLAEVQTQLVLSHRLELIDLKTLERFDPPVTTLIRQLQAFRNSLEKSPQSGALPTTDHRLPTGIRH